MEEDKGGEAVQLAEELNTWVLEKSAKCWGQRMTKKLKWTILDLFQAHFVSFSKHCTSL